MANLELSTGQIFQSCIKNAINKLICRVDGTKLISALAFGSLQQLSALQYFISVSSVNNFGSDLKQSRNHLQHLYTSTRRPNIHTHGYTQWKKKIYPSDNDFRAKRRESVILDELTLILPPSPIKHQGQAFDQRVIFEVKLSSSLLFSAITLNGRVTLVLCRSCLNPLA